MATLLANALTEILTHREFPCISLYQPTFRSPPEKGQNIVRFRQMLGQVQSTLEDRLGKREAEKAVESLTPYAQDPNLWREVFEGIVFFSSPGFFRVIKTHRPIPERVVVADDFQVKPLIRILQSADRYQLLGITRTDVRIFEGDRDGLNELPTGDGVPRTIREALPEEFTDPTLPSEIASDPGRGFGGPAIHSAPRSRTDAADADTERFFRVVDRAMLEHHSQPSGLPLILVALPEHHASFRSVSENPHLLDEMIGFDIHGVGVDKLRELAWSILEPRYLSRLSALCEEFQEKKSKHLADDDLTQLGEAAVMSRIRTLFVDSNRREPGRIDENTGSVERGGGETATHEDVFDDLAELVLSRGGEVIVVPSDRMPTVTGVAGIYRF